MPGQGQAYIPHLGGPGYTFGNPLHFDPSGSWSYMAYTYPTVPVFGQVPQQSPVSPGAYAYVFQPNGAGSPFVRQPYPYPTIDPNMPAAQMTNSSGGVGCEPGYNYFFSAETTKAHVFYSDTPPWQLPPNAVVPFKAAHIPCSVLCSELLRGFGCTNEDPKKNKCVEIVPGGNGKWYKGIQFSGKDKDMMKKPIKDLGWDETRTGQPNEKPVVCLWFCKD